MRISQWIVAVSVSLSATVLSAADPLPVTDDARGELLLQIEQLRQETQALRGLMEELSNQLRTMQDDEKSRYLDLDRRLGELIRIQREAVQSAAAPVPITSADGTEIISRPEPTRVPAQEAYNLAFQMIRDRQFEESLAAMAEFISRYPDSALIHDARFWRGQVYDVLADDANAIKEYEGLLADKPDYRRLPQVQIKLGKLYLKTGQTAAGQQLLNALISADPDSVEAGLARRELEAIR
jgi:TolA-binding protein